MDKIYLGKIVTTHGIKGEIKILSDLKEKNKAFKIGNNIYIKDEEFTINSYRVHKCYDMITLKGYNNINDVLKFIKFKVYIDRKYFSDIDYLEQDLIGLNVVYNNNIVGKIKNIENIKNNPLLIIKTKDGEKYIPNNKDFIEKVDLLKNKVYIKYVEGLL